MSDEHYALAEEAGVQKYLPSCWHDEAIPEPQRDVNDFIWREDGGTYLLMPKDKDEHEDFWRESLEPGQIVAFNVHEWYGWHTIRVHEDGTFAAGSIPAKANCFCLDGDIDFFSDDLAELVKVGTEDGVPLPAGDHRVTAYWWDRNDTSFRFVVDADGAARFEPCTGAN